MNPESLLHPQLVSVKIDQQRVAIFSDTHLRAKFEPDKFKFLQKLISEVDLVIINGDFWDYGETSFDEFVKSKWQALFPLLKEKKAIYLYGNHDLASKSDQRVNLFSAQQGDQCHLDTRDRRFVIRHGHLLALSGDVAHPEIFGSDRMVALGNTINLVGVTIFGQKYLNYFAKRNKKMKQFSLSLADNEILVCGHSHLREKNLKQKFINPGVIRWGRGQYVLIEGATVRLVDERY